MRRRLTSSRCTARDCSCWQHAISLPIPRRSSRLGDDPGTPTRYSSGSLLARSRSGSERRRVGSGMGPTVEFTKVSKWASSSSACSCARMVDAPLAVGSVVAAEGGRWWRRLRAAAGGLRHYCDGVLGPDVCEMACGASAARGLGLFFDAFLVTSC